MMLLLLKEKHATIGDHRHLSITIRRLLASAARNTTANSL
jgi:hypothetical protein